MYQLEFVKNPQIPGNDSQKKEPIRVTDNWTLGTSKASLTYLLWEYPFQNGEYFIPKRYLAKQQIQDRQQR